MFTHYTGNRQFDLQLNRSLGPILDRPGMDRLSTKLTFLPVTALLMSKGTIWLRISAL